MTRQGNTFVELYPKMMDTKLADTSVVEEAIKKVDVTNLKLHQCVATSSMVTIGEKQFDECISISTYGLMTVRLGHQSRKNCNQIQLAN